MLECIDKVESKDPRLAGIRVGDRFVNLYLTYIRDMHEYVTLRRVSDHSVFHVTTEHLAHSFMHVDEPQLDGVESEETGG